MNYDSADMYEAYVVNEEFAEYVQRYSKSKGMPIEQVLELQLVKEYLHYLLYRM